MPPTRRDALAVGVSVAASLGASVRADDKPVGRSVPAKDVYSTTLHDEHKELPKFRRKDVPDEAPPAFDQYDPPFGYYLALLLDDRHAGGPDLVLVRAKTIEGAVEGSGLAWAKGFESRRPMTPHEDEDPKHANPYWLAANLGMYGSGKQVRAVEVFPPRVRLTYRPRGTEHEDEHRYYVWAPLGG